VTNKNRRTFHIHAKQIAKCSSAKRLYINIELPENDSITTYVPKRIHGRHKRDSGKGAINVNMPLDVTYRGT